MKTKYLIYMAFALFVSLFYSCELDPDFTVGEVPTISNLSLSNPSLFSCDLPCSITFTASAVLSFPENPGDTISYSWDFDDGSTVSIGSNVIHEYDTAGEYNIILTASAPGVMDTSIIQSFTVNPNSTFINTTETGLIGIDVAEVSDGYIVFGLYSLIKYNEEGTLIKTIDVRDFIDGYFYGDHHRLSEDNFLLIAHDDGMRATIDNNLNFFNLTVGFYGTGARIAAVAEINGGLIQLGTSNGQPGGDGFYGAVPLIPSAGPQAFSGDPNYWLDYYSGWLGNEPIPGIRPPKHLELDNEFYIPVTSNIGPELYGFNGGYKFYDNLALNSIKSITDGQDNNLVLLANDGTNLVVQEVDKSSGAIGTKTILCDEGDPGIPQSLTTTSDGYIIVTKTNSFWNCISEFTLGNDIVIRLTKLDFQYNTVWDKIIEVENASTIDVEIIKEASNGGFIMTGTARTVTGDQLLLIKTNSEGVVIP